MHKVVKYPFVHVSEEAVDITNEPELPEKPAPPVVEFDGGENFDEEDLTEEEKAARLVVSEKALEELKADLEEKYQARETEMRKTMEAEMEERISKELEQRFGEFRDGMVAEQNNAMYRANSIADKLVQDAQKDADTLMAEANVRAATLKSEARQKGFQEGLEEGKKEGAALFEPSLKAVDDMAARINGVLEEYIGNLEDQLVNTVMEMVGKVLGMELKTDPHTILQMASSYARTFPNCKKLKLTFAEGLVSKEVIADPELVKSIVGGNAIPKIEVEIDEEAQPGTILLESGQSMVDASIPNQLDLLREILDSSRHKPSDSEEVPCIDVRQEAQEGIPKRPGQDPAREGQRQPQAKAAGSAGEKKSPTVSGKEDATDIPGAEFVM